jgi:hypothetical protein
MIPHKTDPDRKQSIGGATASACMVVGGGLVTADAGVWLGRIPSSRHSDVLGVIYWVFRGKVRGELGYH